MNPQTQALLDRTFDFGVNVLIYLSSLKYNDVLGVPKKQLSRSAVSIGANYEESQAAESKRDFIHKIGVVCKESRESHYWIRVLKSVYEDKEIKSKFEEFGKEAMELKSIFSAIKLSAEGKRGKDNG